VSEQEQHRPKIDPDYRNAWDTLNRCYLASLVSYVLFLPAAFLLTWFLKLFVNWDGMILIAFVVISLAMLPVSARYHAFSCPRCHRPFFRGMYGYNTNGQKCVHCGLPKYALNETGSPKLTDYEEQ
jgi:hypothetical protein